MKSLRKLMYGSRLSNWLRNRYQHPRPHPRPRLQPDELLTLLTLLLIAMLLLLSGCATLDCHTDFIPNWNALQTLINSPTLQTHPAGMVDHVSFFCYTPF